MIFLLVSKGSRVMAFRLPKADSVLIRKKVIIPKKQTALVKLDSRKSVKLFFFDLVCPNLRLDDRISDDISIKLSNEEFLLVGLLDLKNLRLELAFNFAVINKRI